MKRAYKYILLLFFLAIEFSFAQEGPIYSRYGIGDIIHSSTGRRLGFGGLGSAVIDKDYVDGYNPASWTNLYFTRFGISLKYLGANYEDNHLSSFHSNVIFSGFTFGFPVQKDYGISMAIGLVPVSVVKYNVEEEKNNEYIGYFNESFSGKGSLSKVFLGTSVKAPFQTSIGAALEFYTGTNNYYSKEDFSDNSDFQDIFYDTKYKYSGLGGTVSVISGNILKAFSNPKDNILRISGMVNFTSDLITDTSLVTNTSIGEIVTNEGETTTVLPTKYTFGASFAFNKKYLIIFDYIFQPWTKYQFDGVFDPNLKDLAHYSLGFEYKDKTVGMHASTFERMSFRAGISYEETQYTFNGININQIALHGGFTVPFSNINLIDFGFSAGMRGTTEQNLIKEKFISASVTLSLGELWFVREDR